MMINHPTFMIGCSDEDIRQLAGSASTWSTKPACLRAKTKPPYGSADLKRLIDVAGVDQTIICSDLGLRGAPRPVAGFRIIVDSPAQSAIQRRRYPHADRRRTRRRCSIWPELSSRKNETENAGPRARRFYYGGVVKRATDTDAPSKADCAPHQARGPHDRTPCLHRPLVDHRRTGASRNIAAAWKCSPNGPPLGRKARPAPASASIICVCAPGRRISIRTPRARRKNSSSSSTARLTPGSTVICIG